MAITVNSSANRGAGQYINVKTGQGMSSTVDPGAGYRKVSYEEARQSAPTELRTVTENRSYFKPIAQPPLSKYIKPKSTPPKKLVISKAGTTQPPRVKKGGSYITSKPTSKYFSAPPPSKYLKTAGNENVKIVQKSEVKLNKTSKPNYPIESQEVREKFSKLQDERKNILNTVEQNESITDIMKSGNLATKIAQDVVAGKDVSNIKKDEYFRNVIASRSLDQSIIDESTPQINLGTKIPDTEAGKEYKGFRKDIVLNPDVNYSGYRELVDKTNTDIEKYESPNNTLSEAEKELLLFTINKNVEKIKSIDQKFNIQKREEDVFNKYTKEANLIKGDTFKEVYDKLSEKDKGQYEKLLQTKYEKTPYFDSSTNKTLTYDEYKNQYGIGNILAKLTEDTNQLKEAKEDLVYYKDMRRENETVGELWGNVERKFYNQLDKNKKADNVLDVGKFVGDTAVIPYNISVLPLEFAASTISGEKTTFGITPSDTDYKIDFGKGEISSEGAKEIVRRQIEKEKYDRDNAILPYMKENHEKNIKMLETKLANMPDKVRTLPTVARDTLSLFSIPRFVGGEVLRGLPSARATNDPELAEKAREDFLRGDNTIINKIYNSTDGKGYFLTPKGNKLYAQAFADSATLSKEEWDKKYVIVSKSGVKKKEGEHEAFGEIVTESAILFTPLPKIGTVGTAAKILQKGTLYNMLVEDQSAQTIADNLRTGVILGTAMKGVETVVNAADVKAVEKLSGGLRTQTTTYTVKDAAEAAKQFKQSGFSGVLDPLKTTTTNFAANKKLAFIEKTGETVGKYVLPAYFTGSLLKSNVDLYNIASEKGYDTYVKERSKARSELAGMMLAAPVGTDIGEKIFSPVTKATSKNIIKQIARNPESKVIIQEGSVINTPGTPFIPESEFVLNKSNKKEFRILNSPGKRPTLIEATSDIELAFDKDLRKAAQTTKTRTFDEAIEYSQWSDLKQVKGKDGTRVKKALEAMKSYLQKNSSDVGLGGSTSSTFSYAKDKAAKIFKNKDLKSKDFDVVVKTLFGEGLSTNSQAGKIAKEFTSKGLNVDVHKGEIDLGTYFTNNPRTDIVIHPGQGGWEVSIKTANAGSEHFASIHGIKATGLYEQLNKVSDIQDFSRTTSWVKTDEGINVLNPALQARRKLMGGYESGRPKDIDWFKNVAYEGYSNVLGDAPRPIPSLKDFSLTSLTIPQQKLILSDLMSPSVELTGSAADAARYRDAIRLTGADESLLQWEKNFDIKSLGYYRPSDGTISVKPFQGIKNKTSTLLHEIQHSTDPYITKPSNQNNFLRLDQSGKRLETSDIMADAKKIMDEKTFDKFLRRINTHTASKTIGGANKEALSYFSEYAPKEVLNPTTQTGKYIKNNLAAGTRNQLEAFDLIGNVRPVFSVEKTTILNPYEVPKVNTAIISLSGKNETLVSANQKQADFFKKQGFLETTTFTPSEGKISLGKNVKEDIYGIKAAKVEVQTPKQKDSLKIIYDNTVPTQAELYEEINTVKSPYINKNVKEDYYKKIDDGWNILMPERDTTEYDKILKETKYVNNIDDYKNLYNDPNYVEPNYPSKYETPPPYEPPPYEPPPYEPPPYDPTPYDPYPYDPTPYIPPYNKYPLYASPIFGAGSGWGKQDPEKKKGEKSGRKVPLIQLKSSLFRKFAFGEKDLITSAENIGLVRETIGKKGSFFGYDAIPTQEQLNRAQAKALKNDMFERTVLGKENEKLLKMKI